MTFPTQFADWTVRIGTIDISDLVQDDIQTDRTSTDYPTLGRTLNGESRFSVRNDTGDFTPDQDNNWFTRNGFNRNGFGAIVTIRADNVAVFTGVIFKVDMGNKLAVITCLDRNYLLTQKQLTNFGIDRAFRMALSPGGQSILKDLTDTYRIRTAAGTYINVLRDERRTNPKDGIYEFRGGVGPFSDGSVTIAKSATENVTIVDEVNEIGLLDSDNVEVNDTLVESEGGPIEVAANSTFPRLAGKGVYRDIDVFAAAEKIRSDLGLDLLRISTPPRTIDLHSEVIGRPGFDTTIGNIGVAQYLSWTGYCTGAVINGDYLYIALSCNRGADYFSRILRYNKQTTEWETYFTHNVAMRQIFHLAFLGDHLVFSASDARNTSDTVDTPVVGSYQSDVPVADRKCLLQSVDTTQTTLTAVDLVPKNSDYPIQLGQYFQVGTSQALATSNEEFRRQFILPDVRRSLLVSGTNLYYYYARTLTTGEVKAGIARVAIGGTPTRILHHECGDDNQYQGNFAINGNTLYYWNNFTTNTTTQQRSQIKVSSATI